MKNTLKLCLSLVLLTACGHSYEVVKNQNSAMVTGANHIEGDLPTPSPTPNMGETPPTSPTPVATATPNTGENPPASPTPVASATPQPSASPNATATPRPSASPVATATPKPSSNPFSQHSCGDQKVKICHIPKGNEHNPQTICVSINGAINGHGVPLDGSASSTGDYLGDCTTQAAPSTKAKK